MGRLKTVAGTGVKHAANDNLLHRPPGVDAACSKDVPSLTDVGPILAIVTISAGTFYSISSALCGYIRLFPIFYP